MPGTSTFSHWTGCIWKEHWWSYGGDSGISFSNVSEIFGTIFDRLGENGFNYNGVFNNYTVETWSTVRSDCPPELLSKAGLTYPLQRLTRINPNYDWSVYAHEFGHEYHLRCKMLNQHERNVIGDILTSKFNSLRPSKCMSQEERFAEDFKYFFGLYGYGQQGNKDYDAPAHLVPGLKVFIQGCFPVSQYLGNNTFYDFSYNPSNFMFMWWKDNRWECFYLGHFYFWNGSWVNFNA